MKNRVLLLAPLLIACGPFFYQAPPPLDAYPQRIPGKAWHELFLEAHPPPVDPATEDQLRAECRGLGAQLLQIPLEERLAKIDALMARNREGEFDSGVATYLQELRELAADYAVISAAQSYLQEREERIGTRWIPNRPYRYWNQNEADHRAKLAVYDVMREGAMSWIEKGLASCPPALEANYRVQRAGFFFHNGEYAAAANEFRGVIQAYPDHPRAEVAAFMLGRCLLEDMRRQDHRSLDYFQLQSFFASAARAFASYLEKYPEGRFVPDAHGWRAAVMLEMKRPEEAAKDQLARLSSRSSREVIRSVMRECDAIFTALLRDPDTGIDYYDDREGLPCDEMAKHPEVARLFVFRALDPAAGIEMPNIDRNLSSDAATLNFLNRRIIAPRPYTRRALTILGEAVLQASEGKPDAFTLMVLGWASQMGNEPGQALALFDRALAITKSDDLLQGRAAALNSLGRHAEAAATYQDLAETFPGSPLAQSATFDRALALYRAGEAGDAFLDLLGCFSTEYDGLAEGAGLQQEFELRQWVDGIAQFGQLEALAKPLATLPADDPRGSLLRAVVRCRALAAHRFDFARQYLDPAAEEPADPEDHGYRYIKAQKVPPVMEMDEARWQRDVVPLADAYQRLAAAGGQDPALHLEIGRLWRSVRGRVTYPLQQLFDYSQSEPEKLDLLRRLNAAILGLSTDAAMKELELRDELDHALAHFRSAAELSQDPAIVAPALEGMNEILFRLAEFSHYRAVRAVETDAMGLSARIVARLQSEFPDRLEAKRAVTWTFIPPLMMDRWMPGDYNPAHSADALLESLEFPEPGPAPAPVARPEDPEGEGMEAILAGLQKELDGFNRERPQLAGDVINERSGDLYDNIAAASIPGMTPGLYSRYQGGALAPEEKAEGALLAPHLDYRLEASKQGEWWDPGDPEVLIQGWREYLNKYPDGPRSDAASLRWLRWRVRQVLPVPMIRAFHFPDSPIPHGYKRAVPPEPVPSEELESLARDIASHELRFTRKWYAADVAQLRAAVAVQRGDYDTAVTGFSSILADPLHPELRMTTARYFAEMSLRLLDVEQRAALADAFRKHPEAMPWLRQMVKGDTCLFRLRPLMPWLEAKILEEAPSP